MSEMSSIQDDLKRKLDQLECHFTWDIIKEDLDFPNLLNRLEEQDKLDLGREERAARAQCSLGYVKFLLNCKEEALTHLSRSESLIKENCADNSEKTLIVTFGNFAWINYHMENYTECESYLKKLQKIHEAFPTESSPVPEVLGEKGWAYLKFSRKYYDRAVNVFQKAVEMDPKNTEWNAGYALALYRTETSYTPRPTIDSAVIKQLRQAIDLNPDDDDVLRVLLAFKLLSFSKELMKECEELVETALDGSPEHPHVMRYVGLFLRNQGSVDQSIALLEKALERSPNSSFIYHQLGTCYMNKKINLLRDKSDKRAADQARNQSIYYLKQAILLKPSFILAMCELALQYGERCELQMAEEQFDKAFKTAKEKNEHLHLVHFYYGEFQQYKYRHEDLAIKHYKTCLTLSPDTSEGKRSAKRLMDIAKKKLSINQDDWKANKILALIYQTKGEMFGDTKSYEATSGDEENDEFQSNLSEINC